MKTENKQKTEKTKQISLGKWIVSFTTTLGLPLLFYYGYCFGLWGRNNLLLQHLFQCNCPASSEEWRYPGNMDIVISACRTATTRVRLSPSGHFLYIREENQVFTSAYLLDLQTMQRIEVITQPFSSFITDDLWFVESGIEGEIIDRITGKQYPIKIFRYWRENAYINGNPNLELLIYALFQAEQIYFTQKNDTVIVLMSSFPTNLEQNFTFDRSDIQGGDSNKVEKFLQENNIVYQAVYATFPHEMVSPNGKLIARDDGIYRVETNQRITTVPPAFVMGWASDGQRVIYHSGVRCLLRLGFPFAEDAWCVIEVPQPVLLLKVPEEYLLPIQTP